MNLKRFFLTSIAILMALVVGAALNSILHFPSVQAQESQPLTIPKSYGTLKGSFGMTALIFEDTTGTIRIVNLNNGGRGAIEIRRN